MYYSVGVIMIITYRTGLANFAIHLRSIQEIRIQSDRKSQTRCNILYNDHKSFILS